LSDSPLSSFPVAQGPQAPGAVLETSMASSLRRMERAVTVGSLLSRTFEVWWRNVFRFAAMLLLLILVVGVLVGAPVLLLANRSDGQPSPLAALLPITVMLPVMLIFLGGLCHGTLEHLAQRPVRIGGMLRTSLRRFWPLLASAVLAYLATLVGFLLLIVPGILVALGLTMVPAVAVAENLRPIAVLRRSWRLSAGSRGTLFLAGLALSGMVLAVLLPLQFALTMLSPIAGPLLSAAVQLFLSPLLYALPAVLYHDLRLAQEGAPTADLLQVFE